MLVQFYKKHQKKFLAVFTVGLMLTFTASFGNFGPTTSNPVVAHIGNEDVTAQEQSNSRHLWQLLNRIGILHLPMAQEGQAVPAAYILGFQAKNAIDQDPDSFLLLQKEARKMGMTVSNDGVEELMHNQTSLSAASSPEEVDEVRRAFTALLLVEAGYQRAVSVIKLPEPQKQYTEAMFGQSITLKYVSYDANEYKAAVPAPTPEQLKQQFTKYQDTLAGEPDEKNPFGFGYEVPSRLKLEVLAINRADLRQAVKQSRTPQDWEFAARIEYNRNLAQYPTSRPSTSPELPTGVAAPSTQPTTRPLAFNDYKEQITNQLMDDAETKLLDEVRTKIASTLQADWTAYHAAVKPTIKPSTRPTTQPAPLPADGPTTDLGVPYNSPEYLPKLALAVQHQFKFLPVVQRIGNWLSEKDLSALPQVGTAELASEDPRIQPLTLSQYAMNFLDAFGHQAKPNDPAPTLSILSPSPALTDLSRNEYLFRVIAADPAHPAADMAPVAKQVETDYRLAAAQAKAREQVDKLQTIAEASNLDAAAVSAGRKVFTTSAIRVQGIAPMPELPLKPESQRTLVKAAFDLLKHPDPIATGKALAVVELPLESKVLLVAPNQITAIWPAEHLYRVESSMSVQLTQQAEQGFQARWFDPKEVQKRMNYRIEEPKKNPDAG